MEPKQVIVVRKDLEMNKGKIAAQVAHASMGVIFDQMKLTYSRILSKESISGMNRIYRKYIRTLEFDQDSVLDKWMNGIFVKIVLSCDSEKELESLYTQAKDAGIITTMIVDAGRTEFNGVPTKTCIAIGPDYPNKIDEITGHLKLLR